jgi:MgtC family
VAVCYSAGFACCIAHLFQIESMLNLDPLIWSLAAALGIGLLIGTERERRKGTGPRRSAAGLRTFTLASLTGAVSVIVGGVPLLGVATAGIFGLAALAYWRGETDDPGLTRKSRSFQRPCSADLQ